jgi:retron-type reverse transcriptase
MNQQLIDRMSDDLSIAKDHLDVLIRSAPYRYKVYEVPKHSGDGMRTIAQPAREIKRLQYWMIRNIFPYFTVHPAATAYTKGKSIKDNAAPHLKNAYFLKLDFKNFFPSIKGHDFTNYLRTIKAFAFPENEEELLLRILFWRRTKNIRKSHNFVLSIGAPTSPYLSNAILFNFDTELFTFCDSSKIAYTRYADDMTFSTNKKNLRIEILKKVNQLLKELKSPRLHLNETKTVFTSKSHRRTVTGITIDNNENMSLGRNRKRFLRAQVHHFSLGKLSEETRIRLKGHLAFAKSIEPEFIRRLIQKYGDDVIGGI